MAGPQPPQEAARQGSCAFPDSQQPGSRKWPSEQAQAQGLDVYLGLQISAPHQVPAFRICFPSGGEKGCLCCLYLNLFPNFHFISSGKTSNK